MSKIQTETTLSVRNYNIISYTLCREEKTWRMQSHDGHSSVICYNNFDRDL